MRNDSGFSETAPVREDRRRLREAFYAVFDRSRAEQWLRRCEKGSEDARLIGEGIHFRAFRWPTSGAMDLVVKVPGEAGAEVGSPRVRRWQQALERLRSAETGLIPPWELVGSSESMGLVMPFAEASWEAAGPDWQPLDRWLERTGQELQRLGLVCPDAPQGGCWRGIPFLYDLSDLAFAESRFGP